jgi:DNA-binding beta-propeller fold protein YncE
VVYRRGSTRGRCRGWVIAAGILVLAGGCTSAAARPAEVNDRVACSTRVAAGRPMAGVRPVSVPVPGPPTAVVGTADGRWEFASLTVSASGEPTGGRIAVLALGRGAPRLVRTVGLPGSMAAAYGIALTNDGRLLLVAGYTQTAVMSVSALEDGRGDPVAGVLADAGTGQFEVAVSRDDRYVFVTDETTGGLSVFDLSLALRRGFSAPGVAAGIVPLVAEAGRTQIGPVGVALSPDGSLAYVTTSGGPGPAGQLWVVDTGRAEAGAGRGAVLAHVAAGCGPVRVAVSPDGSTAWVTAQESNALLAFSTADLRRDPARALRAVVRVGSEPTGLLLADNGRLALVANSNRFAASRIPQTVSVIDTSAALARRPALAGAVPAGLFPRDLAYDPATGQVLLANFNSGTIEEFPEPKA